MTARLIIQDDPVSIGTATYAGQFKADLQKGFDDYISRFDYTTGSATLTLYYTAETQYALASGPGGLVQAGTAGVYAVMENSPTQGILTGASTGPMTGVLYVSNAYIANVYQPGGPWAWDIPRAVSHELNHILGNDYSLYDRTAHTHNGQETTYDVHVLFGGSGEAYFTGPNAEAVYGGMVPLDKSLDHPNFSANTPSNVNKVGSVMDYNQDYGWTSLVITPLDVAIAKDNGVPMLTDNERDEHFWTRACDVLFHHEVSTPAIEAWAKILEGNGGDLVGTATQFLGLLGIHSMTGQQLVDAANSDAERAKLEMQPNISYAHTIEEEIPRIYHLATGQQIDPQSYAKALEAALSSPINSVTLQTKVAPIFLSSALSAANFSHDVDHTAACERILVDAGITNGWDSFPDATKAAILTMPIPDLVVALADNATYIAHQAIWGGTAFGPLPGMIPAIPVNLNHAVA
jgi:hypothetical protein